MAQGDSLKDLVLYNRPLDGELSQRQKSAQELFAAKLEELCLPEEEWSEETRREHEAFQAWLLAPLPVVLEGEIVQKKQRP